MSCTDCFNGCAEIISDKCIKYTGIDIPELGIKNGDSLLKVEGQITSKILTLIDGSGIYPKLDPNDICSVVQSFMPCCPPFDLNDVLTAFVKALCDVDSRLGALKDRVIVVEDKIVALNSDYIIGCLTGVTTSSDTHEILQATINKVCAIELNLLTNYVRIDQIDTYIETFIDNQPTAGKYYANMIPWVAVPMFKLPPSSFDGTGAGFINSPWEKVYLCNGDNGTPDLRGVVIPGATTTQGVLPMDSKVDPNPLTGIPAYPLGLTGPIIGDNTVILGITQIPAHNHTPITATINDPGHIHALPFRFRGTVDTGGGDGNIYAEDFSGYNTATKTTGITIASVTPTSNGGNQSHQNYQPARAAYYIMYIP